MKPAKRASWYDRGFQEGRDGQSADPPWNKGHRDHTSYMEGFEDGQLQLERDSAASNEDDDPDA